MPNLSKRKLTPETEADWYASPEGRKETLREFRRALKDGTSVISGGANIPRTHPAALQELLEQSKEKMTCTVSIHLPVADIELAEDIARRRGVGYQAVLKEVIAKGLREEV